MIIIEAGATQTKVCKITEGKIGATEYFDGISPTYMSTQEIQGILSSVFENVSIDNELYYYGTGCASEIGQNKIIESLKTITNIKHIQIESDLLGAARALAKNEKGQINILGTGSASCLYDGDKINQIYFNTGYLFGDYGSGYHIGRSLLKAYFQGELDEDTNKQVQKFSKLEKQELVQKIYKSEHHKSLISEFAKCAAQSKPNTQIHKLITECFDQFIKHQIKLNPSYLETPQYFVGSIAHYFKDELKSSLSNSELSIQNLCASPIENLAQYHLTYRK